MKINLFMIIIRKLVMVTYPVCSKKKINYT